jgi:hypothetical protein
MTEVNNDVSVPENAQDLTIFVQNLLEQMVCSTISHIFLEFTCPTRFLSLSYE